MQEVDPIHAFGIRWKEKADALVHLGVRLAAEHQLPTLLELIVHEGSVLLEVERCSIFLVDPATNELVSEVALGLRDGESIHVPVGQGVAGHVFEHGEPMIIADAASHPWLSRGHTADPFSPRNMMCVPMRTPRGKTIGVMQALHKRHGDFDDENLMLLYSLASMAAVSIDNSRLYAQLVAANEELEQKVHERTEQLEASNRTLATLNRRLKLLNVLDPLTKVFNRRYLEMQLEHYFSRLYRYNTPFAVIMMDIDFFKKVNDEYGHAAGDEVLKAFARMLRHAVRKGDVPARFGGEEFTVLSAYESVDELQLLAERIRQSASELRVLCDGREISFTVSVGVFAAPHANDLSEHQCLQMADSALYRAKDGGRNQVCFAP